MNTAEMLAELGHQVLEANSGKEALAIMEREAHVDLVITDQAMPHMSGAQLAKELRARWPDLAIVVATGYAELPPEADSSLMILPEAVRAGRAAGGCRQRRRVSASRPVQTLRPMSSKRSFDNRLARRRGTQGQPRRSCKRH